MAGGITGHVRSVGVGYREVTLPLVSVLALPVFGLVMGFVLGQLAPNVFKGFGRW